MIVGGEKLITQISEDIHEITLQVKELESVIKSKILV